MDMKNESTGLDNENVAAGNKAAIDIFLPLFVKEIDGLEPEARVAAWAGLLIACFGQLAVDIGPELMRALTEGCIEGVCSTWADAKAAREEALKGKAASPLFQTLMGRIETPKQ